ncbi:two-component regulator propeller domain-containing protein [Carboxylicivirga sp. N1Y90]|uniref:hybrid sensor histidine kinase/response regulator transcription factor n=1 Tax=Carboxylicivirga fragile TaxID=3417571 RepID=UPI003D3472AA|nr:response regulator [Marinilabiliaceae bacterium N1Y90]
MHAPYLVRVIGFIVFCLCYHTTAGQTSLYRYSSIDIDNGLTNNSVNTIIQDTRGYIWLGSYYGLNRYNGYEIETFYNDANNPNSLSDNFVTALLEDTNGDMWVGTKFGLNHYNTNTEQFKSYLVDTTKIGGIANNQVGAMILDHKNQLWIGTMGGGLHKYHRATDTFTDFQKDETHHEHINHIYCLTEGSEYDLWLGTFGNGLCRYNRKIEEVQHYPFPNMQINALLDDGNGNVWIASNNMGLYRFIKNENRYEKFYFGKEESDGNLNIIMSLSLNKDGNILAAVDGGGIVILDPINMVTIENTDLTKAFAGVDTKAIYSVFIDSNGLYWIGTIGKGVRILNMERNRFTYFVNEPHNETSLSENAVISLLQDKKDRIWVGTDGGGLNLFNQKKGTFKCYERLSSNLKSNVIKRIFEDTNGDLWLGTYGGGLAHFNPNTEKIISYNPASKNSDEQLYLSVWSITQQNEDQLWLGTLGNGLYNFDVKSKKFTPLSEINPELSGVMNDYILSIAVDSKKNLWIGTSNGIYVWYHKTNKYKRYLFDQINDSGVGKNAILTIFETQNNDIWVGSNGGGIIIISPEDGSTVELSTRHGLVHEQVYDIKQDQQGAMWIATQGGISKYEIETGRFQNYDNRDGLMGSAYNTLLNTKSDQLLVGGVKGLNVFNPNVIKINNYVPKVLLTDLLINNVPIKTGDINSPLKQNIAETKELVLNHNQTNIGLEFVAINYFSEKNSYSYILENSSDAWSESSFNRVVKYNNLKPGNYVFRVKAANNDGIWSTAETKLHIKVLAPWWKTWYAYVFYFLILGGIIYGYIRYSILWIDLRRKLQFEVMERQKIKELNQMRLQFFTNISHEFRTPLTLISGPLEALRKKLHLEQEDAELFNIMHKNTNLLLRLINQVLDFRKVETGSMELNVNSGDVIKSLKSFADVFGYMANERDIQFDIHSSMDSLQIQYDEDILEKVVYNLLSNAFKYGKEGGKVELNINKQKCKSHLDRECLVIKVSDDGPGIQSERPEDVFLQYKQFNQGSNKHKPGTGIGLALTHSLVKIHGGSLSVESVKDKGATFTVSIPIIQAVNISKEHKSKERLVDSTEPANGKVKRNAEKAKPKSNYHLLVVDDNKEVVEYLYSLLQNQYHLEKAYDGEMAYDLLQRRTFDMVISDVMMPKMNGIELCDKIKNNIQTSHIPVIMLSAKTSVENRIEGLTTGADAYVPKPFNPDLLEAYIDNLLKSRERLKEIFTGNSIIIPSEVTSTPVDESFLSKALDAVKNNMADENFGVVELGFELNMSRSNLHRKIKAITDKSTTEFIRTVRLKEAAAKLIATEDQISEIAYKVGFNSSSYFIKSFKKEFNMSPGQYKQMQKRWN